MKGNVALLLVLVLVGIGLWYLGGHVARHAGDNTDFVNLYNAAQAARNGENIYKTEVEGLTGIHEKIMEVAVSVSGPVVEETEPPAALDADEEPVLVNAPASIAAEAQPEAISPAAEAPTTSIER